jgi:hypothetical protein
MRGRGKRRQVRRSASATLSFLFWGVTLEPDLNPERSDYCFAVALWEDKEQEREVTMKQRGRRPHERT